MSLDTSDPAQQFRLGVFQFAPKLRDLHANSQRISETAADAAADLLLTPELSLTGYDLRDDVHAAARPIPTGARAAETFGSDFAQRAVLVGGVDRADSAVPYNAAALVECGSVSFIQRKVYLPTYGMFDEGRYFGRGRRVAPFVLNGWRFGVLICEDFWHPMLSYLHALQGAHALLVMAAAPGRGSWRGGEEGAFFASSDAWERIARTYAQLYGMYVVVCNRTGVEGGVTFGGESLVVAPDTTVIARAGIDEALLTVELDALAIASARTPYAHIRDEDAALAVQELQRIMAGT
ncbi:MAG: nitrilase-related carbon-nitrogen hydrolase [Gemmatimonadota bacterium]